MQKGEECPWKAAWDTVLRTSLGGPTAEPLCLARLLDEVLPL